MDYPQVFSKIFMLPDFVRGHYVQWELDTFFNGVQPYNFTLQISQTLDFSEIGYEIHVGDNFYAIDNTGNKQDPNKTSNCIGVFVRWNFHLRFRLFDS